MKSFQFLLRDFLKKILSVSLKNRYIVLQIDLLLSLLAYLSAVVIQARYSGLEPTFNLLWQSGAVYVFSSAVFFVSLKSYQGLSRHSHFTDMWRLYVSVLGASLMMYLFFKVTTTSIGYPSYFTIIVFLISLFLLFFVRFIMVLAYNYSISYTNTNFKNSMIFGTEPHSISLSHWLKKEGSSKYHVVGFFSPNPNSHKTRISGLPVYYSSAEFPDWILRKHNISVVIFPDYETVRQEKDFINQLVKQGVKMLVRPPFEGLQSNGQPKIKIKPIKFEDLLGRDEIKISMEKIAEQCSGKVILVTGGAGSIGSELIRQLAPFKPSTLIVLDSAETPLHNLRLELEQKHPDLVFEPVIGDVRQRARLEFIFRDFKPQIVFHAAAYKHVPLMEENPCEAVMTNVHGAKLLSDMCVASGVESFVMISTDKAVNPTNVMGASKRIAEIYIQSLARKNQHKEGTTRFVTTRFGNVLGSNGSVIPHFREQIKNGGPVTVTHPDIIRYFMTIPEACRLVMEAATFGGSGEIYVFDMGLPVKIVDLARRMIEMSGFVPHKDIEIIYTGLRPGEKLYEELLNDKETTLTTDHEKITVAKVRVYDYDDINGQIMQLIEKSKNVNVEATIRLMKIIVPEFISKNSPFEAYDLEEAVRA